MKTQVHDDAQYRMAVEIPLADDLRLGNNTRVAQTVGSDYVPVGQDDDYDVRPILVRNGMPCLRSAMREFRRQQAALSAEAGVPAARLLVSPRAHLFRHERDSALPVDGPTWDTIGHPDPSWQMDPLCPTTWAEWQSFMSAKGFQRHDMPTLSPVFDGVPYNFQMGPEPQAYLVSMRHMSLCLPWIKHKIRLCHALVRAGVIDGLHVYPYKDTYHRFESRNFQDWADRWWKVSDHGFPSAISHTSNNGYRMLGYWPGIGWEPVSMADLPAGTSKHFAYPHDTLADWIRAYSHMAIWSKHMAPDIPVVFSILQAQPWIRDWMTEQPQLLHECLGCLAQACSVADVVEFPHKIIPGKGAYDYRSHHPAVAGFLKQAWNEAPAVTGIDPHTELT